jgi:predicted nucleic acid-binding protein
VAFVIDASVMLAQPLGQPNATAALARARLGDETGLVPAVWWFEVRNVLIISERRRAISEAKTANAVRAWAQLDIIIDNSPDETTIMTLARKHRLTVHDAAYLELALRERLDLATLDTSLAEAARREGVAVVGDGA